MNQYTVWDFYELASKEIQMDSQSLHDLCYVHGSGKKDDEDNEFKVLFSLLWDLGFRDHNHRMLDLIVDADFCEELSDFMRYFASKGPYKYLKEDNKLILLTI